MVFVNLEEFGLQTMCDSENPKWHYQLLKHEEPGGEVWYGIHEVYSIGYCTKDPIQIMGDSLKDIVWMMKAIESDMKRYGIGNYNDFK